MGKLVKHGGDDTLLQFLALRVGFAAYLDEQTLLEVTCSYPGRVKLLYHLENLLDFIGRCVCVVIESQVIRYGLKVLVQHAVIVN